MKSEKVSVDAPCKINLHLDIKEKRPDGYHNIESVFQLVSLSDRISAAKTKRRGEGSFFSIGAPLPADNTIRRALSVFRQKTGIDGGVSFCVEKRVPAAAGLGGGSSDAAATLRALNELYCAGLSIEELEAMALEIGSDCPFFIRGVPAFVCGRGEKIFRFSKSKNLSGIIIWPAVNSLTKEAYSLLDFSRNAVSACADSFVNDRDASEEGAACMIAEYLRPPKEWRFFNSFADVLCSKHPQIHKALSDIKGTGAHFCGMSGSGSAVFGIFENAHDAESARLKLSALWKSCFKFFFLAFSPPVK